MSDFEGMWEELKKYIEDDNLYMTIYPFDVQTKIKTKMEELENKYIDSD